MFMSHLVCKLLFYFILSVYVCIKDTVEDVELEKVKGM